MNPDYPHEGPFAFVTDEAKATSALTEDIRRIRELLADLEHAQVSDDSESTINTLFDLRRTVYRHSDIIHRLLDSVPRNGESHRLLRLLDQGDDASYITTDEIQQQINDLLEEVSGLERDTFRLDARLAVVKRKVETLKDEVAASKDRMAASKDRMAALRDGMAALKDETAASKDEAAASKDEAAALTAALKDDTAALRDGMAALRDGMAALKDQMAAFTDEGIAQEIAKQLADAEERREVDDELRQIASNMFDVVREKLFSEGGYTSRTFRNIESNGTLRDKTKLNEDLASVARGLGFRHHEWLALSAFRSEPNAEDYFTLDNVDIARLKSRLLAHGATLQDAFSKTLSLLNL